MPSSFWFVHTGCPKKDLPTIFDGITMLASVEVSDFCITGSRGVEFIL